MVHMSGAVDGKKSNLYFAYSKEPLPLKKFRGLDRYGRLEQREKLTREFAKKIEEKFPEVKIFDIAPTVVLLDLAEEQERTLLQKMEEECNCFLVKNRPFSFVR